MIGMVDANLYAARRHSRNQRDLTDCCQFVDGDLVSSRLTAETCARCGKHIGRHYGGVEYRCNPVADGWVNLPGKRSAVRAGYEQLAAVLDDALNHAQAGKGFERHSSGEPFHEQKIVQLCEWMGSNQGDIFQACKKALESTRLPPDRARAELIGAINYLAAAVIVLDRQHKKDQP